VHGLFYSCAQQTVGNNFIVHEVQIKQPGFFALFQFGLAGDMKSL